MILDMKKLINDTAARRVKENEEATITQEVVAEIITRAYPRLSDDDLLKLVAVLKMYLMEQKVARRYLWLMPYLDATTPDDMRNNLHRLEQEMGR
jgi:hypothetical protein